MATDLTGLIAEVTVSVEATAKKSIDLAVPQAVLAAVKRLKFVFGSGADQADQIWWDRRTLPGGGDDGIDMAGGVTNAFGQTITFANIKAIILFNRSDESLDGHTATDAEISFGPSSEANVIQGPFKDVSDAIKVPAGGMFIVTNPAADGWAVTASTADQVYTRNEDGSDEALYDIIVIGESA